MILYTCGAKKLAGTIPFVAHACGRAAHALDKAGHTYDLQVVGGYRRVPGFPTEGKRDVIVELTGNDAVPVLLLDDGLAIQGSGAIVEWAKAHPVG